tara:strand:- start:15230 stop:15508 length:279 start_codon:yes stop_codon:yes gene_type:complete
MSLSDEEMLEEVEKVLSSELDAWEPLDDETVNIAGVEFAYQVNSELHSEELTATLYSTNTEGKNYLFKRKGYKEISYESWISNIWFSWSIDE